MIKVIFKLIIFGKIVNVAVLHAYQVIYPAFPDPHILKVVDPLDLERDKRLSEDSRYKIY